MSAGNATLCWNDPLWELSWEAEAEKPFLLPVTRYYSGVISLTAGRHLFLCYYKSHQNFPCKREILNSIKPQTNKLQTNHNNSVKPIVPRNVENHWTTKSILKGQKENKVSPCRCIPNNLQAWKPKPLFTLLENIGHYLYTSAQTSLLFPSYGLFWVIELFWKKKPNTFSSYFVFILTSIYLTHIIPAGLYYIINKLH